MNKLLYIRSRILLGVLVTLTMFFSYYVLQESAIVRGVDKETDELRQSTVNVAQYNSVIEGNILDCDGKVITSASDTGTMGYCYYPSFSYLVGYNKGTDTFGLRGRYQKSLHTGVVGEKGASITLTARTDIQDKAASILSESGLSGSITVLDVKSGRIIALASRRGVDFDVNTISEQYDLYSAQKEFFYAPGYREKDPPGSTFKVVTACAMLENVMADRTYKDTGTAIFDGVAVHNAGGAAYGECDLQKALTKSVNTYFATMAVELGTDTFKEKAADFLVGESIELDFTTIESNLDLENGSESIVALTGFGQGNLQITPLHIAMIGQAIANDGTMLKPWLIDNISLGNKKLLTGRTRKLCRPIKKSTAKRMREMMHSTAVEQYGFDAAEYGCICAKTGTAELGNGYDHIYMLTFNENYVVMCSANDTQGKFGSNLGGWAKEMYRYLKDAPYYRE